MFQRKINRHKPTLKQRAAIYDKYHGHCAYCGCKIAFGEMEVDHLIPVYHFEAKPELQNKSPDTFDNLMPSCRSCNRYKDTYDIDTFRKVITSIPFKLRRDRKTFGIGERYGLIEVHETPIELFEFYFEVFERENQCLRS